MNFIVAIAFLAAAAMRLDRDFFNALLPTVAFLSALLLPMAIGLYFMKNESLNKVGVFCLMKGGKNLSPKEQQEGYFTARAAQDSLTSAGLFCWILVIFVISTESYSGSRIPVYLFNSIMAISPVITYLIFEGLLRILVNRGLQKSSYLQQSQWLSWLSLVIVLQLVVLVAFSYEDSDASIVLSAIFPLSVALIFGLRFIKNKLFVKGDVKQ